MALVTNLGVTSRIDVVCGDTGNFQKAKGREGERAIFVYGFPKSERENIRKDEKEQFKKMAGYVIELSEEQLNELVTMGKFEEI